MTGDNAMTDATDQPDSTPEEPPLKLAEPLWQRLPAAWGIVAGFAVATALLMGSLPADVLAPLAGGNLPDTLGRIAIALGSAAVIAVLMLAIFYVPLPRLGRLEISVPGMNRPMKVRRADAHPDAPPRRPLFAADEIGEPWQPEHTPEPDLYSRATSGRLPEPSPSLATMPVESLISRLETGLVDKPSPAERAGPRAVREDEAEHPSPAIQQQRELSAALKESLAQIGGSQPARA